MHPAWYYWNGYTGWMSYAPYPTQSRWVFAPSQTVTPHLSPYNFGAVSYYQQAYPPTPPYYYPTRTPDQTTPQGDANAPVIPSPPPSPSRDHHRRRHSTRRQFTIHPILALPESPFGTLGLEWDLADNPIRNILDRPEHRWTTRRDLARAAVRDGAGHALERLVLVFAAGLPRACGAEIEVAHTRARPATLLGAVDADAPWATVYDVLVDVFLWLVSPIWEDEMARLEGRRFDRVVRAAEARRRRSPAAAVWRAPYLKIDYLGKRRRFMGMRPATRDEVPVGRRMEEVFVMKLGASE